MLRAVLANLAVATVGGLILLAYDVLAVRGTLPGGDQRTLAVAIYAAFVIIAGSWFTYLWVELPTGTSGEKRRSAVGGAARLLRLDPDPLPRPGGHLPDAPPGLLRRPAGSRSVDPIRWASRGWA